MLVCPKCQDGLRPERVEAGVVYVCDGCGGRMANLSILRAQRTSKTFLRQAWSLAKAEEFGAGKLCPHCDRSMAEVSVDLPGESDSSVTLEICTSCLAVWFDPGEFFQLPREPWEEDGPAKLPKKARELLALAEVKRIAERAEEEKGGRGPDSAWQWLPALLGLPVEVSGPGSDERPVVTWGAAIICSVAYFLLLFGRSLEGGIEALGFVPAEPLRLGGATLLTSLVLHAGVLHLLGNMYFLVVFGDDVEGALGRWGFLFLLFGAHLAGVIAHAIGDPRSTIPLVGASAGISGVIAYYAVAFPRARIGLLLAVGYYRLRWVRIPAAAAIVLWFLAQIFLAVRQVEGFGRVSSLAHLGGATVGLVAAVAARLRRQAIEWTP